MKVTPAAVNGCDKAARRKLKCLILLRREEEDEEIEQGQKLFDSYVIFLDMYLSMKINLS